MPATLEILVGLLCALVFLVVWAFNKIWRLTNIVFEMQAERIDKYHEIIHNLESMKTVAAVLQYAQDINTEELVEVGNDIQLLVEQADRADSSRRKSKVQEVHS